MNESMKLSELNGLIRQVFNDSFPSKIWVVAEISEMKTQRSGHCYLVLVEKDVLTDQVIAQARATIWSYVFRMLRPYFETTTGQVMIEGLKILVQVSVEFHELYGYSLNIYDIDPTYTLGDLARRKTEIISRLTREGVLDMNKGIDFPMVPQRIAVISSETAAGYLDFTSQLANNQAGYAFYHKLFPAIMQGPRTEASVISALETVYAFEDHFDVVVIIRGGGSQFDLSCFDSYNIAFHVAQFPLPVITGIGHEKDTSVVDMVAHTQLKTPTAVAEFLIGAVAGFDLRLTEAGSDFREKVSQSLVDTHQKIERLTRIAVPIIRGRISGSLRVLDQKIWKTDHFIKMALTSQNHLLKIKEEEIKNRVRHYLTNQSGETAFRGSILLARVKRLLPVRSEELKRSRIALHNAIRNRFIRENHRILMLSQEIKLKDPQRILSLGYSITTVNGKVVRDASVVKSADLLKTTLLKGTLVSRVLGKDHPVHPSDSPTDLRLPFKQ